jgi:hypothetical protein
MLHIPAPHNPQLDYAIQQMADAMALLAQNSVAPPRSTRTSSHAPDTFDGSDPSKFTTFMSQIYLHIRERLQDFPTDDKKIFYVRSYLCGTAQQWCQPNIFADGLAPIPFWDGNGELFVQELATNFGLQDPFGEARISLETLSMKPGDRLATYQLKFNTHVVMTGYNEAALFRVFYRGLPSRIKDTMVQNQLPVTLTGLKVLASQLDRWYHCRNTERAAANPPPARKSSDDSSGAAASGGGGSETVHFLYD